MVKKLIFTLIVIAAVVFISFRLNNPGDDRVSSPAEPSFAAEVLSALEQKKAASVVMKSITKTPAPPVWPKLPKPVANLTFSMPTAN